MNFDKNPQRVDIETESGTVSAAIESLPEGLFLTVLTEHAPEKEFLFDGETYTVENSENPDTPVIEFVAEKLKMLQRRQEHHLARRARYTSPDLKQIEFLESFVTEVGKFTRLKIRKV